VNWALYSYAAYLWVSVLYYATLIGRPRKPLSASDAGAAAAIVVPLIVLLVMAGLRLTA